MIQRERAKQTALESSSPWFPKIALLRGPRNHDSSITAPNGTWHWAGEAEESLLEKWKLVA
jgi:hypothetical protein